MALIERFNTLASKIEQIKSMISSSVGEEAPDVLNLNMIMNLDIPEMEPHSLILSPSGSKLEKGKSPFAIMTISSDENTWNEIFDGKISLFGAYTSGRLKANKYRSNRFNIFLLSGLISFLLNMKIEL
ncbi:MAG: hypothetical protein HWN67_05915 [Candidatus Helarchaeota archaeon]|nr:hypothetical protein [Candidatus Helarchaeota archaeon]